MEFYKKIVKPKDAVVNLLSEKECKCESLQAIINEAIKENNKKTLKELVEEINSHLSDLRRISEDLDAKSNEKKEKLIKLFEECLLKIVNNSSLSILNPINAQLQEFQTLTDIAIKNYDIEELKKLAGRMERNIGVLKEIPEVKSARNSQNNNDKTLEVFNKYASLLTRIRTYISTYKKDSVTVNFQIKGSTSETKPFTSNQATLNDIDEKIKRMHVKRQSRLSTVVSSEQTKLSEQSNRENNFRKSLESGNSYENIKPSSYKSAIMEQNYAKTGMKSVEIREVTPSPSTYISRESGKVNQQLREDQPASQRLSFESYSLEQPSSKREPSGSMQIGFSQKSLAERHIEQARTQMEKFITSLKTSNSIKTTPPRTPTQIRKLFNSFTCVQKPNSQHKSIEDSHGNFKSQFEQELKNVQLKNTASINKMETTSLQNRESTNSKPPSRSGSLKYSDNSVRNVRENEGSKLVAVSPPTIPPRKAKPLTEKQKPDITVRKNVAALKPQIPVYDHVHDNGTLEGGVMQTSASQSRIVLNEKPTKDNTSPLESNVIPSQDTHSLIRTDDADTSSDRFKEPTDVAIVIKRESNTQVPAPQRNSFTTFRNSTDNGKESVAFENPIYGTINTGHFRDSVNINKSSPNEENNLIENTQNETLEDFTETSYVDTSFNTLDYFLAKRGRKPSYRREASVEVNNRFVILQPDIAKLEFAIGLYKGLKRDEDYLVLDKMLSKYYVKIDEVPATTAFEKIKKESLRERLNQAHKDLKNRVEKNEVIMRRIFEEQVYMIGKKYGLS